VSRESCLPGQYHVVLYDCTPSQANLRHHQTTFPDAYVVRDLHEVVYLRALPYHSVTQTSSIDRAVCSNLNVIFNDTAAHVLQRRVPVWTGCERIPSGPNACTSLRDHIVAQPRT
jgi:hypothetical protein